MVIMSIIPEILINNGFEFKTLGPKHLDEIYGLINNHYMEDQNHITRLTFSKDFIYWYIKYIPTGFIVGLILNKKIVGMITALLIDMVINNNIVNIPYIDFLCIQTRIRGLGLAPLLIDELKNRLTKLNTKYALYSDNKANRMFNYICQCQEFVIPINYSKLKNIGFLAEYLKPLPLSNNQLHLMTASDIDFIIPKLNKSMEKNKIRPYFTNKNAHHFLLPKKNIVYSFVKKLNSEITDFVTVYKNYSYCLDHNKIISVAQLAFYYHETMELTELIVELLGKLSTYGFDQLIFKNIHENMNIELEKFPLCDKINYHLSGAELDVIDPSHMNIYPF